jgi:hypothetical protein
MDSIDFSSFKTIKLEDKTLFQKHLAVQSRMSCECNFSSLYSWGEKYQYYWTLFNDRIVNYCKLEGEIQMPFGKFFSAEELTSISDAFINNGWGNGTIYDVPAEYLAVNPEVKNYYDIEVSEDHFDYIYSTSKLCRLDGKRLRKKRNQIKQFKHDYPHFKCVPLEGHLRDEVLELALKHNEELPSSRFLDEENVTLERAFKNFDALDLEGIVLFVEEDQMAGFSVFSRLNPETYDVLFEKAGRQYRGAAQMVTRQVACCLHGKCKYINREQDLGIQGLRRAKRALDPVYMYKRYTLIRKKAD